jgi:predicted RNase H-like HicB family nuclease
VAVSLPLAETKERRVSWIWYWAILDRESEGFIASVPDLGGLAAYGASEKEAVAHVADRASEYIRALVESGKPVPTPASPLKCRAMFNSKSAGP